MGGTLNTKHEGCRGGYHVPNGYCRDYSDKQKSIPLDKQYDGRLYTQPEVEKLIQEAEDKILDEKMQHIDKMISDFICKRIKLPMQEKPEIEEDPINYEPLVRQIRDYARDNAYGNRILDRAINIIDDITERIIRGEKK